MDVLIPLRTRTGADLPVLLRAQRELSDGGWSEALAMITAGAHFDLILCDLLMPGMGGAELYRALERTVPELVDRVVLMTGGVFDESGREFLEQVENRTLAKPFTADDVRAVCDAALDGITPGSAPRGPR